MGQIASIEEKEAIVEGLIKKFGEPDLRKKKTNSQVFTWGKRVSNDRSKMPMGKDFKLPVAAVEAQLYNNGSSILTILILTDDLYLEKTEVTIQTVY